MKRTGLIADKLNRIVKNGKNGSKRVFLFGMQFGTND